MHELCRDRALCATGSCGVPGMGLGQFANRQEPHMLVPGFAAGLVLHTTTPLSFWGGVDPSTGEVIDVHHPLKGKSLRDHVLSLPGGRGSCSGSLGVLECIYAGNLKGIMLRDSDEIIALGALVANIVFEKHFPVAVIGAENFAKMSAAVDVRILAMMNQRAVISVMHERNGFVFPLRNADMSADERSPFEDIALTEGDKAMLRGDKGKGAQEAIKLVLHMARIYGATKLTDVKQAHIDACIYVGPASLKFAQHFASLGARFAVPTTLNAVSAARDWKALGVKQEDAQPGIDLAEAYISMGADANSLTCAPYLLESAPARGDSIVWAESNAVVYANSVLGARTIKYPDMLDVAVALTGRAPLAGCHLDSERRPTMRVLIDKSVSNVQDDAFWPLLGYHIGHIAGLEVVLIQGLEGSKPSQSALKAFGAGFGTSSASPMFHIRGVTPEAADVDVSAIKTERKVTKLHLKSSWNTLNSASNEPVGLVALGNPHLALDEFASLAKLVKPRAASGETVKVPFVLTAGRQVVAKADKAGYLAPLRDFGATIVEDTCWCMIRAPVVPEAAKSVLTNSSKYAHYGPGGIGKPTYFAGLAACVEAAATGQHARKVPQWLQ